MGDHSSSSQQGLAQSEDEDRSPQTANSSDEELDHIDGGDDTEDEGADGEEEQEKSENAEPGAAATGDEQASDEEKTSDLFPPTPRVLSPCPSIKAQPLGLHRRFGRSSYNDYDVITVHGIRDDRNTAWTSKNGDPWIADKLFENHDIRQMDYSYEIDDAARIFHRNGIDLEARALLESLARVRANDPETEWDRPIIWICHDIGGSIVKQALINAILLQPETKPDDDPDVGMDKLLDIYRKIPVLSSTMIFLGCPHRSQSIEDLEDELHLLLGLPGPPLRHRVLQKIRNLARNVDHTNLQFYETKLLSRVVVMNIFTLPDQEQEPPANVASSQEQAVVEEGPRTAEFEAPPAFAAPFSCYTLTLFQPFETSGRLRLPDLDHLELVRGTESVKGVQDWVRSCGEKFNTVLGFNIKNNYRYLHLQRSLLSLAPPMRTTKVHFDPLFQPPVISWIFEQKAFSSPGTSTLYLHTGERSGLDIAAISQHLSFVYDNDNALYRPEDSVFYFEFDRRDGRYNNIKAMISSYLSSVAWRYLPNAENQIEMLSTYLACFQTWSLDDLLLLFLHFRSFNPSGRLLIFLGCFEQCEETQRQMFMDLVLKKQSHGEDFFEIIVSTSGSDAYLSSKIGESSTINLEHYPCAVDVHGTGTERPDTLDRAFQSLLSNRNALRHFDGEINHLLEQCDATPNLGYIILQWLEYYGRGAPPAEIAHTLRSLLPLTYQNVARVFISSSNEKKQWAKLIWRWVAHAVEPLTTEMLAQAVALHMSPDTPTLSDIDYGNFYQDILQVFGGMIICDSSNIKFSADALYDLPLLCEEGQDDTDQQMSCIHGEMARTCLHYLLSTEGQNMLATLSVENQGVDMAVPPLLLPRDSLIEYALRFWTVHYQASGEHRPVDAAMTLFHDITKRRAWEEAFYIISNPFTRIHRCYFSPLPYMAILGLEDLALMQIEKDKESSTFTKDCWMAITEAARNGHETTLVTLLSHVEVDEVGLQESIHWAALYGKKEVLDTLIAEVQKIENFQWPKFILARAAAAGLENLVSALADADYDMNEEDASCNSRRAMHLAAQFGQDRVIDVMLAHEGADATLRNSQGQTPLRLATIMQAPETVQRLLLADNNIKDDKDNFSCTLALDAVMTGQYKSLEMLIKAGADFESGEMNEYDDKRWARIPIVTAAGYGYRKCVRVLLEHGADPNAYSQQGSALYVAITEGPYIEICRMLLEKGANPSQSAADNEVYLDKNMLLLRAIATENQGLVSLLLEKGADVNSVDPTIEHYDTPLSYAVAYCSIEMIKLLLRWGADANFVSEKETSVSPLFAAAWESNRTNHEYIDLLVSYGANVHWRSRSGKTPLCHSFDSPDHIRSLLKHGSDINAADQDGSTALTFAARYNHVESVRVLLSHTDPILDLDIQDSDGWTALMYACTLANVELVQLLLEAGADVHPKAYLGYATYDTLRTCLLNTGELQIIEPLLENGASVVVVDNVGNTLLHNIRTTSPVSTIKVLVEAGAPVDAVNNNGYTPLGIAVQESNIEAAKYLMDLEGVRVDVRHPSYGSILHMAVRSSSPLELTKMLIAAGADYTFVHPESGESLLYTFLGHGHCAPATVWKRMLRYLVEELHVDVNAHGGKRKYPILQLLKAGHDSNTLKYLIRKGARVDVTDKLGRGPVHYAAIHGGEDTDFAALFKAEADFLLKDNYSRLPLHFAAGKSRLASLQYLLKILWSTSGFDIDVTDVDGWTPLMWYCRRTCSRDEVSGILLVASGADTWVRSKDGEWSPQKVAKFHAWKYWEAYWLDPGEDERTRRGKDGQEETWDLSFHDIDEGAVPDKISRCLGCSMEIRGTVWRCVDCKENMHLCFKCQPHSSTMHDADHAFRPDGEEAKVEESLEEEEDDEDEEDDDEDEEDIGDESVNEEIDGSSADEPAADASVGSEGEDNQAEERDETGKAEDDDE